MQGSGRFAPVAGDMVEYVPDALKSEFERNGEINDLISLSATFMVGESRGVLEGQLVLPYANYPDGGVGFVNTGIQLTANRAYYLLMWGDVAADARENIDLLIQSSGGGGTIGTGNTLTYNDTDLFLNGPHTPSTDGTLQYNHTNVSTNPRTWGFAILYERD